jgi:hypothetical protein
VALETSQHTFGFFEREGFVTEQITRDWYAPGLDRYEMILTLDGARREQMALRHERPL